MGNLARTSWVALLGATVLAGCSQGEAPKGAPAKQPAAADCGPNGDVAYVCGVQNLEDLVQVPGKPIVLAASYGLALGERSFTVIDTPTRKASPLRMLPASARPVAPYGACPGPVDMDKFSPHGIALRENANGVHTLYVVNHSARESIEVFNFDARGEEFTAQWVGCVVMPDGVAANAVVPLKDGGFLLTKFFDPRLGKPPFNQFLANKRIGAVLRWHPRDGISQVPGTASMANNGAIVSPDETWLYFTSWVDRTLTRLPLNGPGESKTISVDFMPDNIRFDPNGALLVAGQINTLPGIVACKKAVCPMDWAVARVDPETLAVSYLYWEKGNPTFAAATTALQVGDEFWLGTFVGGSLAVAPVPEKPLQ